MYRVFLLPTELRITFNHKMLTLSSLLFCTSYERLDLYSFMSVWKTSQDINKSGGIPFVRVLSVSTVGLLTLFNLSTMGTPHKRRSDVCASV